MAEDAGSGVKSTPAAGAVQGSQAAPSKTLGTTQKYDEAQKDGSKLPDKSTNEHVSTAARLNEGKADDQKTVGAIKEASQAGAKASEAAQKAAPTGKDIPELAAEDIKGTQTAISRPDQPKSRDDLKARGAQTEPALIAKDGGSIPHGMVSSPTGLVPASAVGGAPALARYEAMLKKEHEYQDLTEKQLSSMNKHEIRAVASDRNYKIGEGSVRALTRRFLEAQEKSKDEARQRVDRKLASEKAR